MKLYTGNTPMALRVNVTVAEKAIALPAESIDVMAGETRTPEFLAINCLGEVPVLEVESGTYLTESIAICRYLDSLYPQLPLFGQDPLHTGRIDMWTRRIEFQICAPIGQFALHSFPLFADRIEQFPEYAQSQLKLQSERWAWFDEQLSDGRTYIVDDKFSIADVAGMTALLVSDFAEQPVPESLTHVKRWEQAVRGKKGW